MIMGCERFKEMILDSIVDEYDPEKNAVIQKHILTCADCRLEYEQIQSALGILKPESGEGLTPIEKLKLVNRIYEVRLKQFTSRNYGIVNLKRLAAIAAALFFFFLGFSVRSFYSGHSTIEDRIAADQRIEAFPGGRFLLMAKGKKALAELESVKQLP
jgi:hypothetical protein